MTRFTEEERKARACARARLHYAIQKGRLPNVLACACQECGQPAQQYHHHRGYAPEHVFDVVALCLTCHAQAHTLEGKRMEKLLTVRISPSLQQRIENLADSMGYDKPDLVRELLDHAVRNPPDWMGKLADALRMARDTVSA